MAFTLLVTSETTRKTKTEKLVLENKLTHIASAFDVKKVVRCEVDENSISSCHFVKEGSEGTITAVLIISEWKLHKAKFNNEEPLDFFEKVVTSDKDLTDFEVNLNKGSNYHLFEYSYQHRKKEMMMIKGLGWSSVDGTMYTVEFGGLNSEEIKKSEAGFGLIKQRIENNTIFNSLT